MPHALKCFVILFSAFNKTFFLGRLFLKSLGSSLLSTKQSGVEDPRLHSYCFTYHALTCRIIRELDCKGKDQKLLLSCANRFLIGSAIEPMISLCIENFRCSSKPLELLRESRKPYKNVWFKWGLTLRQLSYILCKVLHLLDHSLSFSLFPTCH